MLEHFDAPHSLPLIAPRALLIANGEMDPRCPLDGVRLAFREAEAAYEAAGVPHKLRLHVERGVGHEVTVGMWQEAERWLDEHLLAEGQRGGRAEDEGERAVGKELEGLTV